MSTLTLDPRRYRDVLTRFATGVTIVTTADREGPPGSPEAGTAHGTDRSGQDGLHPWGTTVNAFTAVSLEPPLILVCIAHRRSIHPVLVRTGRFAVNILGEDGQDLSDCFAGAPSALPRSAFCRAPYRIGAAGVPILDAAIAYLECEVERAIDAGDHTVFLGRVVGLGAAHDGSLPLLYFRRRYLQIERAAESDLLGIPDV